MDSLTTNLNISREEFVKQLLSITDEGSTSLFSSPFEAFSSSKREFKGQVHLDRFELRRKHKLFATYANMALASGVMIEEKENNLIIQTEISGFNNHMIILYIFLIIFYSIFLIVFAFSDKIPFWTSLVVFIHGAFMFLIPYWMMRSSVKNLKYELEREFYYLTKK